jgi:hypothetical protein
VEDAGNLAWIVALSVGVGGTWSVVLLFATGNLRGEGEIDGFTRIARQLAIGLLTIAGIPLGVISPVANFVSGLAIGFPLLGIVAILALNIVWIVILAPLLVTSWRVAALLMAGLLPALAVLIPVDVFLFSLAALRWRSLQT